MSATAEITSSERPRSAKDGAGASEEVVSNSVTYEEVKMVHFRAASGSSGTRHGCARQTVRAVGSICTSGARAGPRGGACSPTALTRARGADSTAGKYTGCRCAIWGRVQITHLPNVQNALVANSGSDWHIQANNRRIALELLYQAALREPVNVSTSRANQNGGPFACPVNVQKRCPSRVEQRCF